MTFSHLIIGVLVIAIILYLIPIFYPDIILSMLNIKSPKEHFIKPKSIPSTSLIYYDFPCSYPKANLIYVQGGYSKTFQTFNVQYCTRLSFFNYNVYMFHYRDIPYDESLMTSCLRDLRDMYHYVTSISDLPCVLLGYSFGGVVVSNFISKHNDKLASVVLIAPLGQFHKHLCYIYPFLKHVPERIKNSRCYYEIERLSYPTLILNSSSDIVAPASISNVSYHGNVYFSTFRDLNHLGFGSIDVLRTVDSFISLHL